jgi:hypothetical protein
MGGFSPVVGSCDLPFMAVKHQSIQQNDRFGKTADFFTIIDVVG